MLPGSGSDFPCDDGYVNSACDTDYCLNDCGSVYTDFDACGEVVTYSDVGDGQLG